MSREEDFQTVMEADTALMATLTGGVYTVGTIGRDGISRDTTPSAFDSNGYLLPCALVKQRDLIADNQVIDLNIASAAQVIEIYFYQDSDYGSIETAYNRCFALFNQRILSDSFPCEWIGLIDREQDGGALKGASLARQDWLIPSIQGAL